MMAAIMLKRRQWLGLSACLTTSILLVSCASLLGPRTINISREEMLSKLGQKFPATKRVLGLLDVEAAAPELTLIPERNRVVAKVTMTARELMFNEGYKGHVTLSFGLRYEPKDLSIRLKDPKVEQVVVDGLPAIYQRALSNMGARFVEDSLQDLTVHQFKPEDLRNADRMGYQVGEITVSATGLAVHLTPKP